MGPAALALLAGATAALALPVPDAVAASVPVPLADAVRWLAPCFWPLVVRPNRPRVDGSAGRRAATRLLAAATIGALATGAALVGEHARRAPFEPPFATGPGAAGRAGSELVVTGRVVDVPRARGAATSFTLRVETIGAAGTRGTDVPVARGSRLRLASRVPGVAVRAGERWRLTVRLGPLDGLANDGGFERERWMLGARLHGRGSVRPGPAPVRLDGAHVGAPGALAAWRERARDRLAALPSTDDRLSVVEALSLGLGGDVDEATRALLRATGTAHLLAISGLHVGLVAAALAGVVAALLRGAARAATARGRGWGRGWGRGAPVADASVAATLVAALGAAAYAAMAGGSLPTRRALAMLAVVAAARLAHRRIGRADGLAAALVAVLLLDPLAPLSAGFWLSFVAVATILWLHGARRLPRARALAALRTHALLGVALLPAGAWFFAEAAPAAPLANLVAVPLATLVVVPASLAAALLAGPLPALADPALALAQAATGLLLELLGRIDAAVGGDGTPVAAALPGAFALGCVALAIAAATWPRRRALLPFVPLLLLPAGLHHVQGRPVAALEVHVLDVGQGLAVLLLTPGHTVLYDTGGARGDSTMLEAVVLPHLVAHGRRRLDALVVSHPDGDHSAGLPAARRRFPGLEVRAGDAPAAEAALAGAGLAGGPPVLTCAAGQGFELDGVRFDALHPAAHDVGSDNDASCVLLVHVGASRVLLPGDVEARAEARLAARLRGAGGGPLPVDLLVSPHHGSRTSSTAAFVAAFPADRVVHPAGLANRFGFPHDDVVMRYTSSGARQHVTGVGGALVFRFDADGPLGPPEPRRRARRLVRLDALRGPPDP